MERIYFDNSATTRVAPEVRGAMTPYFLDRYGNASSLHSFGAEAEEGMSRARAQVAQAVGADPDEIVFTSGGTESDNLALRGVALAHRGEGSHIITSSIEHPAVLSTCTQLEQWGFRVTYLPVDDLGFVSSDELRGSIEKDTVLISIMMANNEIGTLEHIREIGEVASDSGVLFHTDAVQAVGKKPIDVDRDGIDLLSLSAHKFHGPKGVGALFVRGGTEIRPIMYGGGHEGGLRSSTENVPGIVGMGKAIELASESIDTHASKMGEIRDIIIEGVMEGIPGVQLNGPVGERLCNNAHFSFEDLDGKELVIFLDTHGIACSTASACSTGNLEPSHVLQAIGLSPHMAKGSLRVSLSRFNHYEEANYFLDILPELVEELRG